MTLRHVILTWIILSSALFLFSLASRVYLLLRAKRIRDAEAVRGLSVTIQNDFLLDGPFILIVLVLYLCELNDVLILIVGGVLGTATFVLREYLRRGRLKMDG